MQACSVRPWQAPAAVPPAHGPWHQRRRVAAAAAPTTVQAPAAPPLAEADSLSKEDAVPLSAAQEHAERAWVEQQTHSRPAAGGSAAGPARAPQASGPSAPNSRSPSPASLPDQAAGSGLASNLQLLRQAVNTTATRLLRQLGPPPPGFPPGASPPCGAARCHHALWGCR